MERLESRAVGMDAVNRPVIRVSAVDRSTVKETVRGLDESSSHVHSLSVRVVKVVKDREVSGCVEPKHRVRKAVDGRKWRSWIAGRCPAEKAVGRFDEGAERGALVLRESVHDGQRARRDVESEDGAAVVLSVPARRAVQESVGCLDQPAGWKRPFVAREGMKDRRVSGEIDSIDGSEAESSSCDGDAVEVAVARLDEPPAWMLTVGASDKDVDLF